MSDKIEPGISGEFHFTVEKKHLAVEVGSGLVNVFSTAMMIAGMEAAAVNAVQPLLPPGKTTVGVHVDVSHKAATPMGMNVVFTAVLREASGRSLIYEVEARDERELIGKGSHRRVIVDKEAFEQKAESKKPA